MDAGNVVVEDYFSTAARNAQYHSPTTQNELIAACREWIQEKPNTFLFVPMKQLMYC